jgi:hypothetical protein
MIKLVRKLVADERGVLTAGAFIFFLAAFGVFGSVLSVKYYASQKENVLGAAEAAAVTTIRAIHEGRKGEPINTLDDAKAFARAAMVALSDGTDLDRLMDSNIPKVSESADKIIDVKLFKYSDSFEAFSQVAGDGTAPTGGSSGLTEATTLADVGLVVIEVHFTEERQSSLSAGFYNFVSPRRDLQVRAIGAAYVPNCTQTGLYSASSIDIKGRLVAQGPSCIRTDRLLSELTSTAAPEGEMNINVEGTVNFRNKLPSELTDTFQILRDAESNQVEISAPYRLGLSANIPTDRLQERTWRVKEFYDFDNIYNDLITRKAGKFAPDYLMYFGPEELGPILRTPARRPEGSEPAGINIFDGGLAPASVNLLYNCGDEQDQVRLAPGTYENIVIVTECRLIVSDDVVLKNMAILSKAKPAFETVVDEFGVETVESFPSIRIEAAKVGNNIDHCNRIGSNAKQGVLIWTGHGNIEAETLLQAFDTQFIMGSLPRRNGTGEEPALAEVIGQALALEDNGRIASTFKETVVLHGSSMTSLYPTDFRGSLMLNGCMEKNLSNRHFRPHFKPISFVELEPELFE